MPRTRSAGNIPLPRQPHVRLVGERGQPLAYVGLAGFHPTMVSHYHCPGTAPPVNLTNADRMLELFYLFYCLPCSEKDARVEARRC